MSTHYHLDGMSWPKTGRKLWDLSDKLRYNEEPLDREDQLLLASVVDAYCKLVWVTQVKRNLVIKELRKP